MNVLHLALVSPDNDGMIDRGFQERGHAVSRIGWRNDVDANKSARGWAEWADVCFYQGQGNGSITTQTLDFLRAKGVFVVNWTGDCRDDVNWYAAMAPHVDLTLFTNWPDVDSLRALGFNADYLQVGYDHLIYNNEADHTRAGVVFMGSNYPGVFPESTNRAIMAGRMKMEFGSDFALFGHGWGGGIKYLNPQDEADAYRRTLVALNYDHYQRAGFASDRLLRAQACGCTVISHAYPGIGDEHPLVGSAQNIDEMVVMVRHALEHPVDAQRIGTASAAHVAANYRWSNRVERLEQLIEQYEERST